MQKTSPLKRFRELMARPKFIPALGIWDPYTARVAESLGARLELTEPGAGKVLLTAKPGR